MGNPFAITSEELLKRQQGVSGTNGSTDGVQNTQETREAKEKEQLKGTNVLDQTNGGSMATTDGVFQNFDGFVRTTAPQQTADNNDVCECKSATSDAKNAQSEAGSATTKANKAADTAAEDVKDCAQITKKTQAKTKQTIAKVNSYNNQIESKKEENDTLRNEVNDVENEIADLMAEDGQDYTPDVVEDTDSQKPDPAQDQQDGQGLQTGDTTQSIGADTGAVQGGQGFAMNSLPSGGGAEYAPTSLTAMAAQASAQAADAGQGGQNAQNPQGTQQNGNTQQGQNQQNGANRTAANPKAGSSLKAFGQTVGGKNADKIAELQQKSAGLKGTIQSNSNSINSLRMNNTSLLTQSMKFVNNSTKEAKAKQANSQAGFGVAQATTVVGATTTTTGGVITGIASLKMASVCPATVAAGAALMPWGIGTTAAGGAATTAGTFAQGQTTEGINQAGQTTSQTMNSFAQLKTTKQNMK